MSARASMEGTISSTIQGWRSRRGAAARALLLALACAAISPPARAQRQASEYEVKAAYLYNFAKFVKWPAEAKTAKASEFSICVMGENPFGAILENMVSGESIAGKPAEVKRISALRETTGCSILYVSTSERGRLPEILAAVSGSSILTVSDIQNFAQRGGMIEFLLESGKVRFEINLGAAQDAGLNVSSELLKVASDVKRR